MTIPGARSPQPAPSPPPPPATGSDRLAALVAPHRRALRIGAAAQAVAAALWPLQAICLALGLHGLVDPWKGLSPLTAAAGFVLIGALRAALDAWGATRVGDAAEAAKSAVRSAILSAVARWSPVDASRPNAGVAAALAAETLESLDPWLARYEPARLRLLLVPPLILLFALTISTPAALILALFGLAIPILSAVIGLAAKRAAEDRLDELTSMTAQLLDRIRALPDIRLLDAAERAAASFDAAAERLRERTMAVLRIAFLTASALEICAGLGIALIALTIAAGLLTDPAVAEALGAGLLAGLPFAGWAPPLSLWQGFALLLLAPEFFQPFRDFSAAFHDRAAAKAYATRLDDLLRSDRPAILGRGAAAEPLPGPASLRFEGVSFTYPGAERPVLERFDLAISAGERVGLAGASGAGKSTVLALIAGLAAPDAGQVRVAGAPLDDATADAWRARLAWTGQRPHFLAGSLRANLVFYPRTEPPNAAEMARALDLSAAADFAARAPGGLSCPLGETGAGLSGGEGRRVALARLALADREIILADEPTADLDAEARAAVIDGLIRLSEGRTLIVATHDPELLDRLDRVVRLDPRADAPAEPPRKTRRFVRALGGVGR